MKNNRGFTPSLKQALHFFRSLRMSFVNFKNKRIRNQSNYLNKNNKLRGACLVSGFTLIELLIVIAIISILAGIVVISLNPARQFAQVRNSQRSTNVSVLLNAVSQRIVDNLGVWNSTCGAKTVTFTTSAQHIGTAAGFLDLGACLVPTYLPNMVYDPSSTTTAADTQYTILQDVNSRITLIAPLTELGIATITITR